VIPKRIRNRKRDDGKYETDSGRVFSVLSPCLVRLCGGSMMSFIDGSVRCSLCSRSPTLPVYLYANGKNKRVE